MATKTYKYETRCRRCGSINNQKDKMTQEYNLDNWIYKHLRYLCANPIQYNCSYCKKPTVQDVVSF